MSIIATTEVLNHVIKYLEGKALKELEFGVDRMGKHKPFHTKVFQTPIKAAKLPVHAKCRKVIEEIASNLNNAYNAGLIGKQVAGIPSIIQIEDDMNYERWMGIVYVDELIL